MSKQSLVSRKNDHLDIVLDPPPRHRRDRDRFRRLPL